MTPNKKFIILLVLIVGIATPIFLYLNYKEAEEQKAEVLENYKKAEHILHLELQDSHYLDSGDERDIQLSRTTNTDELLERWEAVSNVYPLITFPSKDVEKEDWVKVSEAYINNTQDMISVSEEIAEGEPNGNGLDPFILDDYIHSGYQYNEYFKIVLEDKGIE
ncbi:hypothetical protein [Alkalicoccobacillus murimartini]|uniref:Uncharacterized protein n=1 Tax=Alkalicoccobacillus murimartini TaxID=171685 RepID=A0ABT9YGG2_9BACI|nr:hypothetical protein [Alkalicoccobacillus murimartini]MDQ0206948.1 hypothetical protein [Alkalicoccobacillus murimartini]